MSFSAVLELTGRAVVVAGAGADALGPVRSLLDAGAVVGQGTHEELLDSCPTYVEIVESQQAMEEAA